MGFLLVLMYASLYEEADEQLSMQPAWVNISSYFCERVYTEILKLPNIVYPQKFRFASQMHRCPCDTCNKSYFSMEVL